MADVGVFPTLLGVGFPYPKVPTFQTRVQRAVSGRELTVLDYPYPLWQFTLTFDFLRDDPVAGFNELRTLMGFFMRCQGAFGRFLFNDPTDNSVVGQVLPQASSTIIGGPAAVSGGTGFTVGDVVSPVGGTINTNGGATAAFLVTAAPGGVINALTINNPGAYAIIPGSSAVPLIGGTGTGATVNLTWKTTTQLVRTFGGFVEPILAINVFSHLYYNSALQAMPTIDSNGVVTLAAAFTSAQPTITADFTYYFRCRFVDDSNQFENFMSKLWQLKKLSFISVRP